MTAAELIAILERVPASTEVMTWDAFADEPLSIELVIRTDGQTPVLVLGMEMPPGWTVDGAEPLWTAHDTAARGLAKAQAVWARAKRERVG